MKNKYSRSYLGPLWVTISMSVTVLAMGPLYSSLFGNQVHGYALYLSTGLIFWAFISTSISESCDVFINSSSFIKQTDFPLFIYILRLLARNVILLMHNLVIPIFLLLIGGNVDFTLFLRLITLLPLLIFFISIFLFFVCIVTSIMCTRFRDLSPMVQSGLQLIMFLTPVFWGIGDGRHSSLYILFNPFYYLIDSARYIFDIPDSSLHPRAIALFSIVMVPLAMLTYKKLSSRMVYCI